MHHKWSHDSICSIGLTLSLLKTVCINCTLPDSTCDIYLPGFALTDNSTCMICPFPSRNCTLGTTTCAAPYNRIPNNGIYYTCTVAWRQAEDIL